MLPSGLATSFEKFFVENAYRDVSRECPSLSLGEIAHAAVCSYKGLRDKPMDADKSIEDKVNILTRDYTPFCAYLRHNAHASEIELVREWKSLTKKKKARYERMARVFRENTRNELKYYIKPLIHKKPLCPNENSTQSVNS
ncbi:GAF sensor-containing diguanylate cyclase [Perkinsela sp. CCAP 1560/4]|nr:GAF sensor-containing diguanylate cyclase [Perkinsela sp. CCAP 1560/4]|eukprot:KNH07775.1 GAF sensor-containing diguanylate cyclase [Perkinsela sp. CCAP 1560/4]